MTKAEFIETLNTWGASKTPFLFMVDFEFAKAQAWRMEDVDAQEILFSINGFTNAQPPVDAISVSIDQKLPLDFDTYQQKFDKVYKHLAFGDSYLTNLTVRTQIALSGSLKDVFHASHEKYKLWFRDEFVVFSPETFIRIKDGRIYSYPMKGTIDASIPDAEATVLADHKEMAEHVTIVDLIRNDLSLIADDVQVKRFRYVEEIKSRDRTLLQVSSEISGQLAANYHAQLGTLLASLLPAGSISGAPKPKTVEIIQEAEGEERGYYTGVVGYFDGKDLDSAVMIRYIEKQNGMYFYRSGGGITTQSNAKAEYKEVLDKVYIPVR